MRFDVYGGFEINRDPYRHGIFDNGFWDRVSEDKDGLPYACGCYVFVT
jgi:hypothetical protein